MSRPNIDPAHSSLASPTDPKASQIDANLRLATENAQPMRLRRILQELCQTLPDAHKVTGALLLATQQKYKEKINASKGTQSDDEKDEEEEDEDDESESNGSSDVGENSELSSEEEEEEEDSDDGSDDDMERSELGSGEEDDGMDEEGASTTISTRHMPVQKESRQKD